MNRNIIITIISAFILMLSVNLSDGPTWANEAYERNETQRKLKTSAPKIYTIYNIAMDETAATSSMASRVALRKAQRIALDKLFRKMIRKEDQENIPKLTDGQITELVSGIEVVNEKTSHVRYLADFIVHFSRDKIYNFLSAQKIPFAETLSNPVYLLTVLEKDGAVSLWEKGNEWRKAWVDYDTVNNLVPVHVVEPSLENRMAITAWQAQKGAEKSLEKMANLINARKLYVMSARVIKGQSYDNMELELSIIQQGEAQEIFKTVVKAQTVPALSSDDYFDSVMPLYLEAIKQATYWLDNQWKEKVMIHFGSSSQIKVRFQFSNSEDWFEIEKRLNSISLIRKVVLQNMTISGADAIIDHSGDIDQIILTLNQENLLLEEMPQVSSSPMNSLETMGWQLTLKK